MFPSCGIEVILRHGLIIQENRLIHGTYPSWGNSVHRIREELFFILFFYLLIRIE
jgi:hypothetical protein